MPCPPAVLLLQVKRPSITRPALAQDANFVKEVVKELPGVDSTDPRILSMLDKIKEKRPPTAAYSSSLCGGGAPAGYATGLASSLAAVAISPLSSSVSTRWACRLLAPDAPRMTP